MSMHEYPVKQVTLGSSLTDDCPYLDTDATLVYDGEPRVEIPLDLGHFSHTTLYAHLDPVDLADCYRMMIAASYVVGERVVDLKTGTTVTVRECADHNGTLMVASPAGTYRLSAQWITRPRTMEAP